MSPKEERGMSSSFLSLFSEKGHLLAVDCVGGKGAFSSSK